MASNGINYKIVSSNRMLKVEIQSRHTVETMFLSLVQTPGVKEEC